MNMQSIIISLLLSSLRDRRFLFVFAFGSWQMLFEFFLPLSTLRFFPRSLIKNLSDQVALDFFHNVRSRAVSRHRFSIDTRRRGFPRSQGWDSHSLRPPRIRMGSAHTHSSPSFPTLSFSKRMFNHRSLGYLRIEFRPETCG